MGFADSRKDFVDYIRKCGGRCDIGKRKSLFDLAYPQYKQQYAEFVKAYPQISKNGYIVTLPGLSMMRKFSL